jgi:hypothetical protein
MTGNRHDHHSRGQDAADGEAGVALQFASGLLDDSDVSQISGVMQPGSVAVVVIYENRWVLGLVDAWRHDGARLIANGGLSADELVAALDATEPS